MEVVLGEDVSAVALMRGRTGHVADGETTTGASMTPLFLEDGRIMTGQWDGLRVQLVQPLLSPSARFAAGVTDHIAPVHRPPRHQR